jgi:hypothetical protein
MVALFLCRTPLQSLIINSINKQINEDSDVVYLPTSPSTKHINYFERLDIKNKYFVPWKYYGSDILSQVLAWYKFPKVVKRRKYNSIFFASIGTLAFNKIISSNPKAKLHTFDDGILNLDQSLLEKWTNESGLRNTLIKIILLAQSNSRIMDRAINHYTIFPVEKSAHKQNIEQIQLLTFQPISNPRTKKKIILLLGSTWFDDIEEDKRYRQIAESFDYHIFIPHPTEENKCLVHDSIAAQITDINIDSLIAEDLVINLIQKGFEPVVYGFNSTALITLSRLSQTINIALSERLDATLAKLFSDFGVKNVSFEFFLRKSARRKPEPSIMQ